MAWASVVCGTTVAVIDRIWVSRRGLVAILAEAGFNVRESDDGGIALGSEQAVEDSDVAVVVCHDWTERDGVRELAVMRPGLPVLALAAHCSCDRLLDAYRSGAKSVLGLHSDPRQVVAAVAATAAGVHVAPWELLRGIAESERDSFITEAELTWLRELRDGRTVATLAAVVGYSERSMYRKLQALYTRMGVACRAEAIEEVALRHLL